MYHCSDSDSKDSDDGVRFKTESVRNKNSSPKRSRHEPAFRRRPRSRSKERYTSKKSRDDRKLVTNRRHRRESSSSLSESEHWDRKKSKKDIDRGKKDRHRPKDKYPLRKDNKPDRHNSRPTTSKETNIIKDNRSQSEINIVKSLPSSESVVGKPLPGDLHKTQTTGTEQVEDSFGPALPPHLSNNKLAEEEETGIGPVLPPDATVSKPFEGNIPDYKEATPEREPVCIGPALPPHLQNKLNENSCAAGPTLPPDLVKEKLILESKEESASSSDVTKQTVPGSLTGKSNATVGPDFPAGNSEELEKLDHKTIGPVLPPHLRKLLEENIIENEASSSDEEESFGPLPAGKTKLTEAHLALEERALQMKLDQLDPKKDEPTREAWMLELPEASKKNFGFGPRQFRAKAGPDLSDRSAWTDTPSDKAKKRQGKAEEKVDLKEEYELKQIRKRDKEQEAISKKHKKRKESLVDSHQKKLKKEKNQGPTERKPFSRETDLQVNKFDEAQKKAILKKAQLLDDRFSTGQSKFL